MEIACRTAAESLHLLGEAIKGSEQPLGRIVDTLPFFRQGEAATAAPAQRDAEPLL